MTTTISDSSPSSGKSLLNNILLFCGILSSLLYIGMLIFVPIYWETYSSVSQTVSELSAIGAPTKSLWNSLGVLYGLLVIACGIGILRSARRSSLRTAGIIMIVYGAIGFFWPPMHQREVLAAGGGTLTDTLHLVFTTVTVALMLTAICCGAIAFGKRFRIYSIATIVLLLVFGFLTSLDAPNVSLNLPTPLAGVWERINIGAYMLWLIVFSVTLLRFKKLKK